MSIHHRLLITLLTIPLCHVSAQVAAPGTVEPGDPLFVTVLGSAEGSVRLEDESGSAVAVTRVFPVTPVPGITVGVAALGIDTMVRPGSYALLIEGDDHTYRVPIEVTAREFRRENIALSESLTDLRTREDPRKTAEARELQRLTREFNPAAVFHPGPFAWPVELTRRTSLFGDRRTYSYSDGESALSIHIGLDLASPTGTPVRSSGAGRVRMARYRIVTGYTVVVEHLPGVFSLYYHLNEVTVQESDMVSTGDVLGTVGATGLATGPHLHWEFRVAGVSVDPEAMLGGVLVDFGP